MRGCAAKSLSLVSDCNPRFRQAVDEMQLILAAKQPDGDFIANIVDEGGCMGFEPLLFAASFLGFAELPENCRRV